MLFVISAETPSSRQASATSNTTRPQAIRPIASPVPVRPPSRSSESSEGREARIAAGRPAISVESSAAPTATVDDADSRSRSVHQLGLSSIMRSMTMRIPSSAMDASRRPMKRRDRADHEALGQHVHDEAAARWRRAPSAPSFRARDRPSARAGGSRRSRRRSAARSRPRPACVQIRASPRRR